MTCQSVHTKFLAAFLGAATMAAWSIPASAETVRVRNIRVSEAAGDTAVVIATSARPTFTTWKLEQPARVVVELSGARLGDVEVPIDAGTFAVGLVSASVTEDDSAGPRTRIVLTLRQASDYRVEAKGNDITLQVVPRVHPPVAAPAKATAAADSETQRKTEAKLRDESKQRLAAEAKAEERSRAEAAARTEADKLRNELAESQRETAKARAEATAATQESQRDKVALGAAEARAKHALVEAEGARKRALSAEGETATARAREQERDKALRAATTEVESRQKALDRIASHQREQQSQLDTAARLVSERDGSVRASEAKLLEMEKEARAARARRDSLASDASTKNKTEAAAALAEAERRRDEAAKATEKYRQELARAVSSRKQEEGRKDEQTQLRQAEEAKLAAAVALRRAEESRLADARAERSRLDQERAKLEAERARLDKIRQELLAEIERSKTAPIAPKATPAPAKESKAVAVAPMAKPTFVAAPASTAKPAAPAASPIAPKATPAPAKESKAVAVAPMAKPTFVAAPASTAKPAAPAASPTAPVTTASSLPAKILVPENKPAPATTTTTGRTRSITLRTPSQVRAIDFVDEPSHASVIIDVDQSATFSVERMAGHRLSLRIEHSELPDGLERNMDATEYLGPVKVISSYRDRAARGTVRVDVDLAEDVPNRVRLQGTRIFWDFDKAQGKAPSLPAVLFVPAQKVAGFVAVMKDGLWLGQNPPPYLVPPVGEAPAGGAGVVTGGNYPKPAAQEGRQGGGAGPGGRLSLGKKRYVGRRIDLDFKGADIHNILRLLADVGQVNVIVADDVKGEVTIKMRDVPWDQALDVVLRSKGLGSVREGNLLRVAPLPLLEKELEAEIARQKQVQDVLPTETRLIGVSYAEASSLIDKAKDLLTPRGKISVDTRTNTLIVTDVVKSLQLIEDLVRNLDTQTSQVVIEARIVEANSNFARQIGVQWGGSAFADTTHGNPTGLVFPYNVGIGGGADDGKAPLGGLVPAPRSGDGLNAANPNFLVNMPAPAGLGTGTAIGLTLGSVAGAFNLNLRLSAMESTGSVRILSSPRITTMDNVEANIDQGVSIPVSTVSAMGAQTQFVDAKLHLGVRPHVTNEGTIALVVNVTRNEPDFVNTGARGDPSIQKKEAKTTMLVRDGDTAVIGGIYTRNTGISHSRVPFFSDIPVLGWFFRNKKENDNRSEFMIFITPRIANRAKLTGQ